MVAVAAAVFPVLFIVPSTFNRATDCGSHESHRFKRKLVKSSYRYDVRNDNALLVPKKGVLAPSVQIPSLQGNNLRTTTTHRKIRQFFKAGTLDIPRISHSIVGLSSILVGIAHVIEVLLTSSFTDAECTVSTILCTGFIHTFAGLLGVRRLNFKNKKEAARNAMFWPAPIQSSWLASVSLTEWGQGSGALISMGDSVFTVFTAFNVLLTFWQLSVIVRKTGIRAGNNSSTSNKQDTIWFKKSAYNAIMVEFSYLLWMQLQMGTVLYIVIASSSSVPLLHDFSYFMDAFPKMQYLLSNLALNTAFFNNLAVFLATLLRYKLVSKPENHNLIVFSLPLLSSVFIVWKVLSCFFLTYDGAMSSSFFSLVFEQ